MFTDRTYTRVPPFLRRTRPSGVDKKTFEVCLSLPVCTADESREEGTLSSRFRLVIGTEIHRIRLRCSDPAAVRTFYVLFVSSLYLPCPQLVLLLLLRLSASTVTWFPYFHPAGVNWSVADLKPCQRLTGVSLYVA